MSKKSEEEFEKIKESIRALIREFAERSRLERELFNSSFNQELTVGARSKMETWQHAANLLAKRVEYIEEYIHREYTT